MLAQKNLKRFEWYKGALEDIIANGGALAEETGLVGKLGELHVAVTIGGTMAEAVNQRGYDLLAPTGERISVKTITSAHRYTHFKESTFSLVDRVVLVLATEKDGVVSTSTVYDGTAEQARAICYQKAKGGFYIDPLRTTPREPKVPAPITSADPSAIQQAG